VLELEELGPPYRVVDIRAVIVDLDDLHVRADCRADDGRLSTGEETTPAQ